jgi:hypothetical protein
MKLNLLTLILLSVLATSCGGGGGGGGGIVKGPGGATVTGALVDAEVQGVGYRSTSFSGSTNSSGVYQCKAGETVEFYLPGASDEEVYLGSIVCRKVTSPIEIITDGGFTIDTLLADLSAPHRVAVTNVLRLLQSLDLDGDPSNGITIDPADVSVLVTYLATNAPSGYNIEEDGLSYFLDKNTANMTSELNGLMTNIGRPGNVVSETDATDHFDTTQTRCGASGCSAPGGDGGGTSGGGGGGTPASVVKCLSGKTYGAAVVEGEGYIINNQFAIDFMQSTSWVGAELATTLIVLRSDDTAEVYRKKNNFVNEYFYSLATSGWTEATPDPYTAPTTTQLVVSQVVFTNGSFNFTFDPRDTSWQTEYMGQSSAFGTTNSPDLVWTEVSAQACVVPTI